MARVDMRTVENKSGVTYDATDTDRIFANDILAIKTAIDDASTGVNTEQLEIGGTLVINSSGVAQDGLGCVPAKEKKRGSNCNGSDGDQNRVLTLANTNTTTALVVMVDGVFLSEDNDYSVSHKSASSTITFLNRLADNSYIEVVRFS